MKSSASPLAKQLMGIGISESYASQLARGVRKPSLSLAFKIHRRIGVQLGPLKGVKPEDMPALERFAKAKAARRAKEKADATAPQASAA